MVIDDRLEAIEQRNEELERRLRRVEQQVLDGATGPAMAAAEEAPPAERARLVAPPAERARLDEPPAGRLHARPSPAPAAPRPAPAVSSAPPAERPAPAPSLPGPLHRLPGSGGRRDLDWEQVLGGRVLAWVGAVTVLSGLVLLFALGVSQGWIGEAERTLAGALVAAGLVAGGAWLHERRGRTEASRGCSSPSPWPRRSTR
jgi:uncharacterized membrane protein